jgi:RimJ/RimL family protein N-acetyltransferase
MSFVPGKVVKEFEAGGKRVRLRYPMWEDIDGLRRYINSVVREKTYIGRQKEVTRKQESEWLLDKIREMDNSNLIMMVAEVDGKVAGSSELRRNRLDACRHVANFGIGIGKDYRKLGVGTEMFGVLAEHGKKEMGTMIIVSSYCEKNEASRRLHDKCGFRQIGRIPKGCNYYGKYLDEIIVAKEI